MPEVSTRTLRMFVGLALLMAGLAEAQTLLQSLRSERRLRARMETMLCARLEEVWPALLPLLESGAADGWEAATVKVQAMGLARELEVFDLGGGLLVSRPAAPPVGHAFDGAERRSVLDGKPHCVAVETSGHLRVFAYAAFPSQAPHRILRLSREEPDLAEDSAERGLSVMVHKAALGLLVLAGLLALWPAGARSDVASVAALGAYERAMEKLRERDVEVQGEHAAERDRLAEALREREAFSRAGEITAQIVHEVRNGLGTIHGYARLLERIESPGGEKGRLIREECEALESTVRRFVELVRDERPALAPFDLGRTLARVVEREARPRDRSIPTVTLPAALPGLVGDESLLERAFENLVRNALDAAGAGGKVAVTVVLDGATVVITVCDDGPGLPAGGQARLMTSTKPGGLGIGLSLARKIVTLHDGSLTLLNREPRGVEAVVALPVAGPRSAGHADTDG
jgi:signal transduction histidine kinase